MTTPGPGAPLRPLGVGEVLDRAVNLCVKFFMPLATIYVFYAIPLGVVTFFSSQGLQRVIRVFTDAANAHGGKGLSQEQVATAFQSRPEDVVWSLVSLVFVVFISPLPTAALIEATTAFYLGRASSVKQAYRVALDRYLNMFGVGVLFYLCGSVVYLILILVVLACFLAFAAIATVAKVAAIVIAVVLSIAATIAIVVLGLVLLLSLQIAYFSCVVERANFAVAFSRSLKRTFTGIGFKRSLLIGLVYVAIIFGIGFVTLAGEALVVGLLKLPVLGTVYETIVRLATAAFTTAFVGIFYLDLRVREEGLDLQFAAERVEPQATLAT